ncbi:MAG: hypothetical protein Fur005_42180 [Roseiflexaceae bacterium]
MIDPLAFFWEILKSALLSTGGGNIPILHDELIAKGWIDERTFAEALTIGQISPGPTGLWVLCLGYLLDGVRGSLLALLGITLPPLLVLLVHRAYRAIGHHPMVEGFVRGLALAVSGVFLVVLLNLMQGNGINPISIMIMIGALIIGLERRIPVIAVIGLAGIIGSVVYQ